MSNPCDQQCRYNAMTPPLYEARHETTTGRRLRQTGAYVNSEIPSVKGFLLARVTDMPLPLREHDPRQAGPYTLESRLGGGGMGEVFLGRSPGGLLVVVKMVREDFSADEGFRRRFVQEIRAARKVGGFYTAQVINADIDAARPWLATAYIPGPSLQEAIEKHGPLPATSVAALGSGLAEGLSAVHAQNLVHRDLKPGNVILAEDGPRLIDFGIARATDSPTHTHFYTQSVIGTAGFMSPEQIEGSKVTAASDVFSLGCVLVYAATGQGPFGSGTPASLIYRIVNVDPDLSDMPKEIASIAGECLEKRPADRPTVRLLLDRLNTRSSIPRVSEGEPWLPRELTKIITRDAIEVLPPEKKTNLVVGNLGPEKIEVVANEVALGSVDAHSERTFLVSPGEVTLRARTGGQPGVARRVKIPEKTSTRLAFDIPDRSAVPRMVESVIFEGSNQKRFIEFGLIFAVTFAFLAVVGIGYAISPTILISGWSVTDAFLAFLSFGMTPMRWWALLLATAISSFVPVIIFSKSSGSSLRLDRTNFLLTNDSKNKLHGTWSVLDQVSLVGRGRDAMVTFWPSAGKEIGKSSYSILGDHQAMPYPIAHLGIITPQERARMHVALRWFARDTYIEQ